MTMKIKVEGTRLQDGLKKVIGVVNAKITPPILGNVLIEAQKGGKVCLKASNLDITLITFVECEVIEPGVTTVPARMLQNVLSALPVGEVEIEVDANDKMRLVAADSSFRISGLSASEFPAIAAVKDDAEFKMEAKDLRKALRKTAYAQSQDDTRRTLRGILFDFAGEQLKTVATDGRRLAVTLVNAAWKCADTRFTVPAVAVREIQRLLSDEGTVTIRYSGNMAVFDMEKVAATMYCRIIDEAYPNYLNVIPQGISCTATCDRARLIDMMIRSKVMAVDNTPSVEMTFDKGALSAKVVGMDDGEGRDQFAIKFDGAAKQVFAFNPYYLHEAFAAIDADNVLIEIVKEGCPVIVKGEGEEGLAVVMPLRRQ